MLKTCRKHQLPLGTTAEPGKKEFNKVFLAIPVAIAVIIVLLVAFSISTDIEEHKAFQTVDVDMCDVYLDGLDFRLELCMYNLNSINVELDRIDVLVYAGDNKVAEVCIPQYITIPANDEIVVDADITIRKTGALEVIVDSIRSKNTDITVQGTVYYDSPFGTLETPFIRDWNPGQTTFIRDWNPGQTTGSISIEQQCNNTVNAFLDVMEFALETSSSQTEFVQIIFINSYGGSAMDELDDICEVDREQGLISSPYLDMRTKDRFFDVRSETAEMLG